MVSSDTYYQAGQVFVSGNRNPLVEKGTKLVVIGQARPGEVASYISKYHPHFPDVSANPSKFVYKAIAE